jgi:ribosomal protein L11 methyltransferase
MAWIQITFHVRAEHAPAIADALSDLNALAVTLVDAEDNPVYEPDPGAVDLWQRTKVIGLFGEDHDIKPIIRHIETRFPQQLLDHNIENIADENWVSKSLDQFQPLRCGDRLWIVPTWHTPPDPHAVNVMLNPGLAFGTGNHATTALCLEWLDANPPAGQTVLDFGCGSGILAIAALKLGAERVLVVDHDPQAIEATLANAAENQLQDRIAIVSADDIQEASIDTLLANILAGPIISLAPRFMPWLKVGSPAILSGILSEQGNQVTQTYQPWFTITNVVERDNWLRIDTRRK